MLADIGCTEGCKVRRELDAERASAMPSLGLIPLLSAPPDCAPSCPYNIILLHPNPHKDSSVPKYGTVPSFHLALVENRTDRVLDQMSWIK